MVKIATLGPQGSDSVCAADQYAPEAELLLFNHISEVLHALSSGDADQALVPVYNTRGGEVKEYFRLLEELEDEYWIDNIVLPIHLSLGIVDLASYRASDIETIIGRQAVFNQCREYISATFPDATLISVNNITKSIDDVLASKDRSAAIIDSEETLKLGGLEVAEREVVSHNRTRFAVLGKTLPPSSGYDATAIITRPLNDRVGMLVDILNEFTRRGVNILDLRSENDIKTQKLQIYLEAEGHISDLPLKSALETIEKRVIQERDAIKFLGSFPRIDMRVKQIKTVGFIGSGDMSKWFAARLGNEGYKTIITGRSSALTPEDMIKQVDVVCICVPISVTADTIKQYGPLLQEGQALILLAGESEKTLQTGMDNTHAGVELMLVHNLWGPQADTMKDKNVSVVRTSRSGAFCSEFEAFLYKHGAAIYHDSANKHDLLMGVGQKLPTLISVALAKTLKEHGVECADISSHSTLTSLYGVLSMVRVHNQNPRTYAEIMSTSGDGRKIVRSFVQNITTLMEIAEDKDILQLCSIMETSKEFMSEKFRESNMRQAKAVDAILSDNGVKDLY